MMKTIKRGAGKLALLAVLLLAAALAWIYRYANTPLTLPHAPYEFALKHGSSLKGAAHQLAEAGILKEPGSFVLLVRMFGKANQLKAGNYQLDSNITPLRLFRMLTQGDVSQSEITFIEGWTFKQMRKALDEHPAIRHETPGLSEQEILARIGARGGAAEGMFFPDTYFFSSGMSDLALLQRAHALMRKRLEEAWQGRDPDLPVSDIYQALILASIVEKETGQEKERPMIAGVFINRLRLGMKLQTDPTVIYGMGESFDGNLRKRDLSADTAYNTYTRFGLPPTPIAMPGWGSIQAALHPAKTSALYFVGKGDGSHQFSASLEEHNRAVVRYQKVARYNRG